MKKRKIVALFLSLALVMLAAAGCGSTTESGESSSGAGTENTEIVSGGASSQEQADLTPESSQEAVYDDEAEGGEPVYGDEEIYILDWDFSPTYGWWYLDGATDTAHIYMDGEGYFEAYYADGMPEASGYLCYCDEYDAGDGSGRYDMFDEEGNYFNGFYFDSDISFHMGNTEEMTYYLEGGSESGPLTIVYLPGFVGVEILESNEDFYGGYYYVELLEDGETEVVTAAVDMAFDLGNLEESLLIVAELMTGGESVQDFYVEEDVVAGYPAYNMSWTVGAYEDAIAWNGLVIPTDGLVYFFGMNAHADFAINGEPTAVWEDVYPYLDLTVPY